MKRQFIGRLKETVLLMALSIVCPCGVEVDFQPDDRGSEVYCSSCGRAVPVPAEQDGSAMQQDAEHDVAPSDASPVAAFESKSNSTPAPHRAGVFSSQGELDVARQIVGHVTCLCETRIPIRPEDFGGTVYCTSCGAEVRVGSTLSEGERAVGVARRAPDETTALPSVSQPHRRFLSWPGAVVSAAIVVFVIFAVRWTQQSSGSLPAGMSLLTQVAPASANETPIAPSSDSKSEAAAEPVDIADPLADITIQAIDSLLDQEDASAALMQAQIWQELLGNYEFPADDLRPARLAEAIQKLMRKLAPPPEVPPQFVNEFGALLRELARVLQAKVVDVAKARTLVEKCERILEQHPDALQRAATLFYTLKSKLRDVEFELEGVRTVERLIEEVRTLAEEGKVAEALEANARAKFMFVRCTNISVEEEDRLDTRARELIPVLRLARAKRYVQDARALVQAGDAQARDRVVAAARQILQQELAESQVRPLLVELKSVAEEKISGDNSAKGREILHRDQYEEVLEHFGRVNSLEEADPFIKKCVAFQERNTETERMPGAGDKVGSLAFDLLESELGPLNRLPDTHSDPLVKLSQLRKALDQLGSWRDNPRWSALNSSLRVRGTGLALVAIDQAIALAQEQKLQEAVSLVVTAEVLGTPAAADRAKKLRQDWQAEIELRASIEAQEKSWARIQELLGQSLVLETWHELNLFTERFPTGQHSTEAGELRTRLRPQVQQKVGVQLDELEHSIQKEKWDEVRSNVALLDSALLSEAQRPRWESIQKRMQTVKQLAAHAFAALQKQKLMTTETDILRVLTEASKILAMDPDHAEAAKLLQQAEQRRLQRVEMLTKMLKSYKSMPAKFREKLEEIIRLDPDGPHGAKARELVNQS